MRIGLTVAIDRNGKTFRVDMSELTDEELKSLFEGKQLAKEDLVHWCVELAKQLRDAK